MKVSQKLLVEGIDDQHVIWGLLKARDFPEVFAVEAKSGVENLLRVFPVQVKGSGVKAVGVVIDADVDLLGRWDSLRNAMSELGYSPPKDLPGEGVILEAEGMPRVGAWIMPDNSLPGMLEDFVGYLVPTDDHLWSHAAEVLANIPDGLAGFAAHHLSKAHIHTWLAWQEDPGTPMGLAITKKYLDPVADTAEPFIGWLQKLFVD